MLRAVLDANVWVSALLTCGKPRDLVNHFENGLFTVIYPQWLLDELKKIPSKPRLAARIHPIDLQNLLKLIEEHGLLVEPSCVPGISRDPKDDIFLACAAVSKSEFVVSGDNDLLCLGEYAGVKIVTPAQFLEILNL